MIYCPHCGERVSVTLGVPRRAAEERVQVSHLDSRVEPSEAVERARSESQRALVAAGRAAESAGRAIQAAQVAEVALQRQVARRRSSVTFEAVEEEG